MKKEKEKKYMIKGIIFDLDGLILDSETVVYQSWQEIYQEHNCILPLEKWILRVGGSIEMFDAHSYLETLIHQPLSKNMLDAQRLQRQWELLATSQAFPGVENCIVQAKKLGLRIGLASSSEREWVLGHLKRLDLYQYFDCIKCGGDVQRVKPQPDIYISVLAGLEISAKEAIALEDSPNGILSAKHAGIFCIAIPNAITSHFSLDHADLQLVSLAETTIEDLILRVEAQIAQTF